MGPFIFAVISRSLRKNLKTTSFLLVTSYLPITPPQDFMLGQQIKRLNGWVFLYELSGCGFESRCSYFKKSKMYHKKCIVWGVWNRLIGCYSNAQAPRFEKAVKPLILTDFWNGINSKIKQPIFFKNPSVPTWLMN